MRRHGEHGSGLCEVMRPGEAATKRRGAESAQLAPRVPPFREIQFAETADHDPQLEETLKIDSYMVGSARRRSCGARASSERRRDSDGHCLVTDWLPPVAASSLAHRLTILVDTTRKCLQIQR